MQFTGIQAYDLASLIDDVRIKVSFKKREMLFNKYVCTQKKVNALNLRHDFEVLSILRNSQNYWYFYKTF